MLNVVELIVNVNGNNAAVQVAVDATAKLPINSGLSTIVIVRTLLQPNTSCIVMVYTPATALAIV